jgi:hypothetical protein
VALPCGCRRVRELANPRCQCHKEINALIAPVRPQQVKRVSSRPVESKPFSKWRKPCSRSTR